MQKTIVEDMKNKLKISTKEIFDMMSQDEFNLRYVLLMAKINEKIDVQVNTDKIVEMAMSNRNKIQVSEIGHCKSDVLFMEA